jgi:hypothetical protein
MKNPPILVSILGFFAALAGFSWLYIGLRLLGFDWFGALGDLPALEQTGLWGWLAIIGGIAWIAAAFGMWSLQPWAWTFTIIIAGLALFEAILWMMEYFGSGIGLASAILPIIIIWYMNTSEIKAQFGKNVDTV